MSKCDWSIYRIQSVHRKLGGGMAKYFSSRFNAYVRDVYFWRYSKKKVKAYNIELDCCHKDRKHIFELIDACKEIFGIKEIMLDYWETDYDATYYNIMCPEVSEEVVDKLYGFLRLNGIIVNLPKKGV